MDDVTVASVMSREPRSCAPEDSVDEVLALMRAYLIRRVPVVDEQGHLVGAITLGDIARAPAAQGDRAGRHAAAAGMALAELSTARASVH
jgi:CBS domain-containing protein